MNATVLFVDLAGFTALTEAHGDQDAADLASRFYVITRASLRDEVRLVKTIGDAVMIAGPQVRSVVAVALRLLEVADEELNFPALRAGLAEGPVVEREGDLFGATVNLAARVAAHARAGQVLCTSGVARALSAEVTIETVAAGVARFKNVAETVELFELRPVAASTRPTAIDPVCRMRVVPERAPATAERDGQVYWFCSDACAHAFRSPLRGGT